MRPSYSDGDALPGLFGDLAGMTGTWWPVAPKLRPAMSSAINLRPPSNLGMGRWSPWAQASCEAANKVHATSQRMASILVQSFTNTTVRGLQEANESRRGSWAYSTGGSLYKSIGSAAADDDNSPLWR
jgi:hypothetical protein